MGARSCFVTLLTLAGCGRAGFDARGEDGGSDTSCAGSFATLIDTCALDYVPVIRLEGAYTLDTTTNELRKDGAPIASPVAQQIGELTVFAADRIELAASATLRITGARPFGLVAREVFAAGDEV